MENTQSMPNIRLPEAQTEKEKEKESAVTRDFKFVEISKKGIVGLQLDASTIEKKLSTSPNLLISSTNKS